MIPGQSVTNPNGALIQRRIRSLLGGQLLAALSTTTRKDAIAANGCTSFTEAVAPLADELTWLIGTFHRSNSGIGTAVAQVA